MEDPFKYAEITFSGVSGAGEAKIKVDDKYSNDIKFTITKENDLKEGEEITVKATSSVYRFKVSEKRYKVQGLYE